MAVYERECSIILSVRVRCFGCMLFGRKSRKICPGQHKVSQHVGVGSQTMVNDQKSLEHAERLRS